MSFLLKSQMGMRVGHTVEADDSDDIETESSIREAKEVVGVRNEMNHSAEEVGS